MEVEIDPRRGGIFRTVMASPDGEVMPSSPGCILEIVENRSLAWMSVLGPALSVRSVAPGDFHDHDNHPSVVDFVEHAVNALANPVPFAAGELFTARGAGVIGKRVDAPQNPLYVLRGDAAEIFGYGPLDDKLIACHAP
jgi:hypothetical protein